MEMRGSLDQEWDCSECLVYSGGEEGVGRREDGRQDQRTEYENKQKKRPKVQTLIHEVLPSSHRTRRQSEWGRISSPLLLWTTGSCSRRLTTRLETRKELVNLLESRGKSVFSAFAFIYLLCVFSSRRPLLHSHSRVSSTVTWILPSTGKRVRGCTR